MYLSILCAGFKLKITPYQLDSQETMSLLLIASQATPHWSSIILLEEKVAMNVHLGEIDSVSGIVHISCPQVFSCSSGNA